MTMRILGLGAGVQSTALALMAAEGITDKLDAAIFADTGWEPKAVYDNVVRLAPVLAKAGIPLYRVGRGSSIREDVLDRHVFATVPAFTITEREDRIPLSWSLCDCVWGDFRRAGIDDAMLRFLWRYAACSIDELHALAGQLEDDDSDHPDHTGDSLIVARLAAEAFLRTAGLDRSPDAHDKCDRGLVVTEWHTYTVQELGQIKRQCTGKYKVEPVERKIRELLGAPVREIECSYCEGTGERVAPWDIEAGIGPCSVCRGSGTRRLVGSVPLEAQAEHWIGFSTDEIGRVSTNGYPRHAAPRFPLIELNLSRSDCEEYLQGRGWDVAKSACIGCMYHTNEYWRDMRDNRPDEWADAVEFDRQFRTAPGLQAKRFVHPSMLPLDQAPIDRMTAKELGRAQLDLFDELASRPEPEGCSPHGCRSGDPIYPANPVGLTLLPPRSRGSQERGVA